MIDRRHVIAGISLALAGGCMPGRNQANIMSNPIFASIEKRIGGRLGVALVDGQGNLISSHRGAERFAMCSTFKAPLASALFAADAKGEADMHAKFTVKPEDAVPYMPFVQKRLEDGKPVTLSDLAKAAVQTSDNAAANLVLKAIGGPKGFTDFVRSKGDRTSRLDRFEPELNENVVGDPRDTTTPVAMGWLMQELLVGTNVSAAHKSLLRDWMIGSKTGANRIRAGLPEGWPVGNKTGTAPGSTAYNDIAIIWPSSAEFSAPPVILIVYTDRPTVSAKKVNAAIADIARSTVRLVALPS